MTEIVVNGEHRALPDGATVRDVVAALSDNASGCAVAINDTVVPRGNWPERVVEAGDRVEVLTAVQGG
jgi:sulfur carrier protein